MGLKDKKPLSTAIRRTGSTQTHLSTTRSTLSSSIPLTSHANSTPFFSHPGSEYELHAKFKVFYDRK